MRNDELHLHQLAVKLRGLRAWASGLYPAMAVVELLVRHRTLLETLDAAGVIVLSDEPASDGGPFAYLDWDAADHDVLAGMSGSEQFCLEVVRNLCATGPRPIDLAELCRLDMHNLRAVLTALAVAGGDELLAGNLRAE